MIALRDRLAIVGKDFTSWVCVGSPLTSDALNNGKAAFPEFHNVYIEPSAYRIYRKTGVFPDGTIMFKELQRTLPMPLDRPIGGLLRPRFQIPIKVSYELAK